MVLVALAPRKLKPLHHAAQSWRQRPVILQRPATLQRPAILQKPATLQRPATPTSAVVLTSAVLISVQKPVLLRKPVRLKKSRLSGRVQRMLQQPLVQPLTRSPAVRRRVVGVTNSADRLYLTKAPLIKPIAGLFRATSCRGQRSMRCR